MLAHQFTLAVEACLTLGRLYRTTVLLSAFVAWAVASSFTLSAHEFWSNGTRVDPLTKVLCCGVGDHVVLTDDQVVRIDGGWLVTFGPFENVFVSVKRVQVSPDAQFHANVWDGSIKCFFAPMSF